MSAHVLLNLLYGLAFYRFFAMSLINSQFIAYNGIFGVKTYIFSHLLRNVKMVVVT